MRVFRVISLQLLCCFYAWARQLGNEHEVRLIKHIFSGYDKYVRPTLNKSAAVNMTFGIAYVQMVELDDRAQTLVSNVWIRQKWYNQRLTWNPADYNNITLVNVDPIKVWLPDIVLYNNAKSGIGAGTMYQFKTKVALRYDGLHTWYAPSIIRSSCNIDITFFPFDDQLCTLRFGSWSFSGYEVNLYRTSSSADLSFYLKSTEFDLVSAKVEREIVTYSCCTTPYPNIVFTIHLRRQPGFFLFNVIIPSMVITFFAILTFSSPHQTGERISLAIESFLSLSFLCMMVSDSIPVNSDMSPLITKFLMTCMILISFTLIFNLVSMNLFKNTPLPRWLRILAFVYVGPLIGVFENSGACKLKFLCFRKEALTGVVVHNNTGGVVVAASKRRNEKLDNVQEAHRDLTAVVEQSSRDMRVKNYREFWRCVGQTVDRLCMILFSLCFVFVSAVMMLKGYGHQLKVQEEKVR